MSLENAIDTLRVQVTNIIDERDQALARIAGLEAALAAAHAIKGALTDAMNALTAERDRMAAVVEGLVEEVAKNGTGHLKLGVEMRVRDARQVALSRSPSPKQGRRSPAMTDLTELKRLAAPCGECDGGYNACGHERVGGSCYGDIECTGEEVCLNCNGLGFDPVKWDNLTSELIEAAGQFSDEHNAKLDELLTSAGSIINRTNIQAQSELTNLRARVAELTELLATTIYDRNKAEAKAKELKRNLSDAQKTILAFERGAQP